jgi:hypothetical protein
MANATNPRQQLLQMTEVEDEINNKRAKEAAKVIKSAIIILSEI